MLRVRLLLSSSDLGVDVPARSPSARCAAPTLPRAAEVPRIHVSDPRLRKLMDPMEVSRFGTIDDTDVFSPVQLSGPPARLHPDAWARLVPEPLLQQLQSIIGEKQRVLLVGDRPGDPDCFSAVGLARFLRAFGVEADTHIGVSPPRQIRDLFHHGELLDEAQVSAKRYDAVLFVDNDGTGARISPAAHAAAANARTIVILDHHQPRPYPVRAGQALETWIEPRADAAALLQLGLMVAAAKQQPAVLSRDEWAEIAEPLFAGIYSDTGALSPGSTKTGTLETVHFLAELLGPAATDEILRGFSAELPREIQKRISETLEPAVLSRGAQKGLLCSFISSEPWQELTSGDLYRGVLDRVEQLRERHAPSVSLALVGLPADEAFDARVMISVRTVEKSLAGQLAKELGNGGGKPNGQAGATVLVAPGQSLDELLSELRDKAEALLQGALDRAQRLSYELGLRRGSL